MSGRDVALSHEHVGFEFLPFEQALKRVTYPTAKAVLRAAHVHLRSWNLPHSLQRSTAEGTDTLVVVSLERAASLSELVFGRKTTP